MPDRNQELDATSAAGLTAEVLLQQLGNRIEGLSDSEAAQRLQRFDANHVPEVKESLLKKLFHDFWGRFRG